MTNEYEIHVTLSEDGPDPDDATGWSSSQIDGDPQLGRGVRYYRTTHAGTLGQAVERIIEARELWPHASRYKIEHVILDWKRRK